MSHSFRICPHHNRIIESQENSPDARWCFYMVTDSPKEAKRTLSTLNSTGGKEEQLKLSEAKEP